MQSYVYRKILAGLATSMLALTAHPGHAESVYPSHPIKIVVPFAADGPTDYVASALAEAMRPSLGQTLEIENKAGAGGSLGTSAVAHAKPDGYTVLLTNSGFSTAVSLYQDPGYDPFKSFEPIGLLVNMPMTLVARADFPPDTITELAEYLHTHQDVVSFAHGGIGAASHLCSTMLMEAFDVKLMGIPYKGTGPAMENLQAKHADLLCDQTSNTRLHINAGKVKAYAVTSLQTVPALPDLPTLNGSGYPGFQLNVWHGMWVPKGTPQAVVETLQKALKKGLANPTFQARMKALGAEIPDNVADGPALTAKVKQQIPQWANLFKKAHIQSI